MRQIKGKEPALQKAMADLEQIRMDPPDTLKAGPLYGRQAIKDVKRLLEITKLMAQEFGAAIEVIDCMKKLDPEKVQAEIEWLEYCHNSDGKPVRPKEAKGIIKMATKAMEFLYGKKEGK